MPDGRQGSPRVTVSREHAPEERALAAWNELVLRTPGSDVTQLSVWATVRTKVGYQPLYLLAYQGDRLVGGALILRRRLLGVLSIGYLPYGPLIDPAVPERAAVAEALVEELASVAGTLRLMFIQPPEHADDISDGLRALGFRPSDSAGNVAHQRRRLDADRLQRGMAN